MQTPPFPISAEPSPPAAGDARSLIRLALPDRPGGLAFVARCLAACGVDILAVEVVGHQDGAAIDDFLVRGGDLERALAALLPEATLLGQRPAPSEVDPALAMASACAGVLGAANLPAARDAMVRAMLALVGADHGVLLRADAAQRLSPVAASVPELPPIAADEPALARRALRLRTAIAGAARDGWAPPSYRALMPARQIACVPAGDRGDQVLVVVRADDFPFVDAEIERLGAFAALAVPRV